MKEITKEIQAIIRQITASVCYALFLLHAGSSLQLYNYIAPLLWELSPEMFALQRRLPYAFDDSPPPPPPFYCHLQPLCTAIVVKCVRPVVTAACMHHTTTATAVVVLVVVVVVVVVTVVIVIM